MIAALLVSATALTLVDAQNRNFTTLSVSVELNTNLLGATGFCVYQLGDGSLVLNSANQSGTYLTKLDPENHIIWTHLIHAGQDSLPRLVTLDDGGFLLAGIVNSLYFLAKTDSAGNVEWTKTLYSDAPVNYLMDIVEVDGGGFVVAGFGEPEIDGLGWIWLTKTDSDCNVLWNRIISGPTNDCPSHIIQLPDGGYMLSDTAYSFVPDQAFYRLIKLDANGWALSNSSYGGYGYYYQPECNSAISTQDGGYLMIGYLWRKAAWVVKVNSVGELQWNQTYGESRCAITAALETPKGFLLQEYLDGNRTGLMLTDKLGSPIWNTTLAEVTMPVGMEANFHSLIETKGGGYIMLASKNNSVWLAKFDYPKETAVWMWVFATLEVAIAATLTVWTLHKRNGC